MPGIAQAHYNALLLFSNLETAVGEPGTVYLTMHSLCVSITRPSEIGELVYESPPPAPRSNDRFMWTLQIPACLGVAGLPICSKIQQSLGVWNFPPCTLQQSFADG